jgi:sporulation protein YlmC with PRC-barrel domain
MNRISPIGIGFFSLLLITPLFAQTPPSRPAAPSTNPRPQTSDTASSGPLQKMQNNWRARTLIGAVVFDDKGQRIATINDLVIADDGRVDQVILSTGRMRRKLVAVPFNQLRSVPSTPASSAALPPLDDAPAPLGFSRASTADRIVLPGATRDSLANMAAFDVAPGPRR